MLAAKQMGAERIIAMSRHETRQALAREFGATDIVSERGDEGVAAVKELTGRRRRGRRARMRRYAGVDGSGDPVRPTWWIDRLRGRAARRRARPAQALFFAQNRLLGGPAPVRRYLPHLIGHGPQREINPGKVFDLELPLAQVAEGYRAMDERRAIKTLLRV